MHSSVAEFANCRRGPFSASRRTGFGTGISQNNKKAWSRARNRWDLTNHRGTRNQFNFWTCARRSSSKQQTGLYAAAGGNRRSQTGGSGRRKIFAHTAWKLIPGPITPPRKRMTEPPHAPPTVSRGVPSALLRAERTHPASRKNWWPAATPANRVVAPGCVYPDIFRLTARVDSSDGALRQPVSWATGRRIVYV